MPPSHRTHCICSASFNSCDCCSPAVLYCCTILLDCCTVLLGCVWSPGHLAACPSLPSCSAGSVEWFAEECRRVTVDVLETVDRRRRPPC